MTPGHNNRRSCSEVHCVASELLIDRTFMVVVWWAELLVQIVLRRK